MEKLNFNKYFTSDDNKYFDPKYLITISEEILDDTLDNMMKRIKNVNINITGRQIEKYLDKKFEENYPQFKGEIKNYKNHQDSIKERNQLKTEEMIDNLRSPRYILTPYTLEYFDRYMGIVKEKALSLLNIIKRIGNRDTTSIQDVIADLDIQLDKNGNISKEDIIRLIAPFVYNVTDLMNREVQANDFTTYLKLKMTKQEILATGIKEEDIYPPKALQIKDIFYNNLNGNVPLSSNQRTHILNEHKMVLKKKTN